MAEKTVRIDFYRIMDTKKKVPFGRLVKKIAKLPDDESRNTIIDDTPVRLKRHSIKGTIHEGDLTRIRMEGLPEKARITGELDSLGLEADEGLGEQTAFLYDASIDVIALQRNRTGVTATKFLRYFEEKTEMEGRIELEPILAGDVIKYLESMRAHRNIEIGFAGIDNLELFEDLKYGVGAIAKISKLFKSPSIKMSIGMGHRKGSINQNAVVGLVKQVLSKTSFSAQRVNKLRVSGKLDLDQETTVLDILEYRMIETMTINMNSNRIFPYEERQLGLRRAWKKRNRELLSMFKEKKGNTK